MAHKTAPCKVARALGNLGRITKRVEQRLGVPQIGGIQALGEPVVDGLWQRAGLARLTLVAQAGEEPGDGQSPSPPSS